MAKKKRLKWDKYRTIETYDGLTIRNKEVYDNRRPAKLCEYCCFYGIKATALCDGIRREARKKGLVECQLLSDPYASPDAYAIVYEEVDPLYSAFQQAMETKQ